jgi:hypothetical protein
MDSFQYVKGHRVHLLQIDYIINNTAAAATLKIYSRTKTGTEKLIYSATNTDDTLTSLTWASGSGKISSGDDEELVIFFDGTVVNATSNLTKIQAIGELE